MDAESGDDDSNDLVSESGGKLTEVWNADGMNREVDTTDKVMHT